MTPSTLKSRTNLQFYFLYFIQSLVKSTVFNFIMDHQLLPIKSDHPIFLFRFYRQFQKDISFSQQNYRFGLSNNIRSRNKIKFKHDKRNDVVMMKSPLYRGIKLPEYIPEAIQRSTTK